MSTFCYTFGLSVPGAAGDRVARLVGPWMLEERLARDMTASLKAGNHVRLSTLRMMRSQLLLERKKDASKQSLTDPEVIASLGAYAKKLKESAAEYEKLGKADEARAIREEQRIVQEYLPAPLTEAEAKELVAAVLAELQISSSKDFGRAMKELTARAQGRADGKLLSELVRASLA
jgi:hypothetical protein